MKIKKPLRKTTNKKECIVINPDVKYYYNPYGGISDDELLEIIEPKHSIQEWIAQLNQKPPIIIQLVGKKGRGKTTHLRVLHQLLTNPEIYFLNITNKEVNISKKNSQILIDSIHHIPIRKRFQLWRKSEVSYVITTHWKRNIEFFLCKRKFKTYHFNGIALNKLENIIKKRVSLSSSLEYEDIEINTELLQKLHAKYGDNIRGILNYLYDNLKVDNYGN